jgi:hypothetical protein
MAEWTLMVYMAGDNNLSDAGDMDLQEMRKVGSTPDVNVVVQFDNAGDRGTNRYLIQKDGSNDLIEELEETDSGDPKVLTDFISWSIEKYPAKRNALILWNHGGGWEPAEIDRIARGLHARNYNVREASTLSGTQMKKTLFRSSIKEILDQDSAYNRAILSDDGTGHSLDTIELEKVLAKTKEIIGKPLDLLGMDACLMSNIEVAYQIAPYVNYITASEESEPGEGWPYDQVLRLMVDKPDISAENLSKVIVDAYIDYYKNTNQTGVTQSAFNLSKVVDAAKSLNAMGEALINHMPDAGDEIWKAQRRSMKFFYNTLWDINHFSTELFKVTSDNTVKMATQDVKNAFQAGPDKFIMAESHLGKWYEQCCGASIYLIPPPSSPSKYYEELTFAKDAINWSKMLQKYHENP